MHKNVNTRPIEVQTPQTTFSAQIFCCSSARAGVGSVSNHFVTFSDRFGLFLDRLDDRTTVFSSFLSCRRCRRRDRCILLRCCRCRRHPAPCPPCKANYWEAMLCFDVVFLGSYGPPRRNSLPIQT